MKTRITILFVLLFSSTFLSGQELSLDSCLSLALQNNAKVKNAQLDVEAAVQVKKQAFTKYFPQISAIAGGYHAQKPIFEYGINDIEHAGIREILNAIYNEFGSAIGFPNSLSLFEKGTMMGATAMQPVFMGGQIVNGNRLANIGVQAAEIQSQLAEQEALLQTEESYWLVISLQEKKKTILQARKLLDTLYKDVTTAENAGILLKNDVLKVTLKRNELQSNLMKVENGLSLAKSALCQAIGIPYSPDILLTDTLTPQSDTPDNLYTDAYQAVSSRREKRLLDLNLQAEKLKRKMVIGATLPQILVGVGCSYGNLVKEKSSYNGLALATVRIPISEWWETSHKIKEQNVRAEQAQNNFNDLTEKMSLQIQQAWNDLEEAFKQVGLADQTVEAATENLKIAADNFHAGLVPTSDLLEAETLCRQAIDQQSDAKISYKIKTARYKILTSK